MCVPFIVSPPLSKFLISRKRVSSKRCAMYRQIVAYREYSLCLLLLLFFCVTFLRFCLEKFPVVQKEFNVFYNAKVYRAFGPLLGNPPEMYRWTVTRPGENRNDSPNEYECNVLTYLRPLALSDEKSWSLV
ncbi:hypothetical protein BDZ91DRAFT_349489 [Kalaharituber pfeilii]|nr:hypothetical protein BDZ91DRAFT_349489 [Kalaharituber pfeilii]